MLLTASHEQLEINNIVEQLEFKFVRKPVTITKLLQEISAILPTHKKSQRIVNTAT
jgi:hypothetical protein